MQYRPLGDTDTQVSLICLGTMTWGEQNTQEQAHQQLDYSLNAGINFFDLAEMYPVPPKPETQGRTEHYFGQWLANQDRQKLVVASKVTGPGMAHISSGPALAKNRVLAACQGSLERMQTDYIDLYQVHWPARPTNFFGKLGYEPSPDLSTPILETLEALALLKQQGKIRHIGLSNETPWGLMQYLNLAKSFDLPRPVSIQNPYNLLNRTFEVGLAEMAWQEQCGLLAYSPLAFGVLTGKYRQGQQPADGRLSLFSRFVRYNNPQARAAAEQYCQLAEAHGLSPTQMALAFINQQAFVTSNIIGATTLAQLEENIASLDVVLDDALLQQIQAIHTLQPNPSP